MDVDVWTDCVDCNDSVRTCFHHGFCNGSDIGNVGCELDEESGLLPGICLPDLAHIEGSYVHVASD